MEGILNGMEKLQGRDGSLNEAKADVLPYGKMEEYWGVPTDTGDAAVSRLLMFSPAAGLAFKACSLFLKEMGVFLNPTKSDSVI